MRRFEHAARRSSGHEGPRADTLRAVADCHLHVVDPTRYPFPAGGGYRPAANENGAAGRLRVTLAAHGVTHGLLVQPSGYGDDNAAMLDAIASAEGRLKGIAIIRPDAPDRHLEALSSGGIVGISLNVAAFGGAVFDAPEIERLLRRVRELDWLVELQCTAPNFPQFGPLLRAADVKVIFPHFGRPDPSRGADEPGFREVLRFGREGRAIVKLSGPFRESKRPYPFADIDPFAEAALAAFGPDRSVWGSDWPFLAADKLAYRDVGALLERWVPDAETRRTILWDAPSRAFGLSAHPAQLSEAGSYGSNRPVAAQERSL